jgi:hypothetical protein
MGRDYSPSKPRHDLDGENRFPSAVAETVQSFFFGLCIERNPIDLVCPTQRRVREQGL